MTLPHKNAIIHNVADNIIAAIPDEYRLHLLCHKHHRMVDLVIQGAKEALYDVLVQAVSDQKPERVSSVLSSGPVGKQ